MAATRAKAEAINSASNAQKPHVTPLLAVKLLNASRTIKPGKRNMSWRGIWLSTSAANSAGLKLNSLPRAFHVGILPVDAPAADEDEGVARVVMPAPPADRCAATARNANPAWSSARGAAHTRARHRLRGSGCRRRAAPCRGD